MEMITTSIRISADHKKKWDAIAKALGTSRNAAFSILLDVTVIKGAKRADSILQTVATVEEDGVNSCSV